MAGGIEVQRTDEELANVANSAGPGIKAKWRAVYLCGRDDFAYALSDNELLRGQLVRAQEAYDALYAKVANVMRELRPWDPDFSAAMAAGLEKMPTATAIASSQDRRTAPSDS